MSDDTFTIKTNVFEGPLDLLLSLIEKRKLFINDISLAQVADDYIEYIKKLSEFPVGTTANFILVASTLLLIKSKSLLPSISLTLEEEGSIEDLEKRLLMYKRIKEASRHIADRFGKSIIFGKTQSKSVKPVFSPEDDITTLNMLSSMRQVIQALPKIEVLPKTVVRKIISLEEMIDRLTNQIKNGLKMNFAEFAKTQGKTKSSGARHRVTNEEKIKIIISFLAMLELVKQGIIEVSQKSMSEDITMETQNLGVPNYHAI
jgi:segregation and condensation protein A